ncbi:MAG: hypothetical protein ACREGI_04705, partial [Candidatus Levyibacteriota bacterium]
VNIDNKADNQGFGDIAVVSTKFSSVSEQIADFLTLLEPQIELDVDTSQNLLNGISFATNDFQSPVTSYLAFEMSGILMKKGAQRAKALYNTSPRPDSSAFFPPVQQQPFQSVAPMQPVQPMQQAPQQPFIQQQPIAAPFNSGQAFVPQQPAQQPIAPQVPQQPMQQPTQQQTPPDWLTPKIYKGSTVL